MELEDLKKRLSVLGEKYTSHADLIYNHINALNLSPNEQVLDIGTGVGKMAIILSLLGFHVLTGDPFNAKWGDWQTPSQRVGIRHLI